MSEKQRQLVEDIMSAVLRLPTERRYQLLGVANGLGMSLESNNQETGK